MKKIFTLALLVLPFFSSSQQIDCGITREILGNPEFKENTERILRRQFRTKNINSEIVYTVPVVVHIYHIGEAEGVGSNIASSKVQEFINTITETYRATGVSAGVTPDAKIQFVLATNDPSCNPVDGIVRVDASGISGYASNQYSANNHMMHNQLRALSQGDENNFLNIRVVYTTSPIGIGYYYRDAFIPYFRMNSDVGNRAFLSHEVAHTLALAHTFQDGGGCADSDGVTDTPLQVQGSGCDPNAATGCGGTLGDAVYNFLSYFSCRDRFTNGQVAYMRETLELYLASWRAVISTAPGTLSFGNISQSAGTYTAVNTITSGANVAYGTYYVAGKSITLNTGFQAGQNEVFEAKISQTGGGCP